MITGAHSIIYSTDPDADREFLKEVLALTSVDVGGGWLIFGLPPAEVAIHPADKNGAHELYLLCDDVEDFVARMGDESIACDPVQDVRWGLLTHVTLPGGGKLGVYEPKHARPEPAAAPAPKKKGKGKAAAKAKAKPKPAAKAKPAAKRPAAEKKKAAVKKGKRR